MNYGLVLQKCLNEMCNCYVVVANDLDDSEELAHTYTGMESKPCSPPIQAVANDTFQVNSNVCEMPDPLNAFNSDDVPDSLMIAAMETPSNDLENSFEGDVQFRLHEGLLLLL